MVYYTLILGQIGCCSWSTTYLFWGRETVVHGLVHTYSWTERLLFMVYYTLILGQRDCCSWSTTHLFWDREAAVHGLLHTYSGTERLMLFKRKTAIFDLTLCCIHDVVCSRLQRLPVLFVTCMPQIPYN